MGISQWRQRKDNKTLNRKLYQPVTYQIKVQGRLDKNWSEWFDNMAITVASGDDRTVITTLTGSVADQTALHGLLTRIRDLGLFLLLVQCLE